MKQHITLEQLNELSGYQKERLNDLWKAQKYDLAVAFICKDASNDEYAMIEFVVGDVKVYETYGRNYYSIILWNLKKMEGAVLEEQEEVLEEDNESYSEDFDMDGEDYSYDFVEPECYGKEDCLPLLSIGQMIMILQDLKYGEGNFYLEVNSKKDEYGIGEDVYQYSRYGNEKSGKELCDVLWEIIKEKLSLY